MTDPLFRSDMTVEVMDHMGDDLTPVRAARLSTGTQAETNPERDRGLLASGRYSEMEGVFYVPAGDRPVKQVGRTMDYQFEQDDALSFNAGFHLRNASADSWWRYEQLLEMGVAKEVARMVLPVNLYSTLWITMNSRSLMNFFSLRSSRGEGHPQYEIRDVADQMYVLWHAHFPETASAWFNRGNA